MKDKLKRLALVLASAMLFCTALTGCFGGGGTPSKPKPTTTPTPPENRITLVEKAEDGSWELGTAESGLLGVTGLGGLIKANYVDTESLQENKYAVFGDVWLKNPEVWLTETENIEKLSVTMRILQVAPAVVAEIASDEDTVNALTALLADSAATQTPIIVRMIFMENKQPEQTDSEEVEEVENKTQAIGITVEAGGYVVGYTVKDGEWNLINSPDESVAGMKDLIWRTILGNLVNDEGIHAFLLKMMEENLAEVEWMKETYEKATSGTTGGESTVGLYSFDEPFADEEFTAYELMDDLSGLSYDVVLEQQLEQMAWSLAF